MKRYQAILDETSELKNSYLFNIGKSFRCQEYLGCHKFDDGKFVFRVWAPNAKKVSVIGSFNDWKPIVMEKIQDTGIWILITESAKVGNLYKFLLTDNYNKDYVKIDPFAKQFEKKPGSAAVITSHEQALWSDSLWFARQKKLLGRSRPINIYELNLGSWKRNSSGKYLTYSQIADELVKYIRKMGYTHVEFMPLTEYLLDASWGYQTFGYFAPTSRFGKKKDLYKLIDKLHNANIGVILDWVPGHFIRNYDVLHNYDGTPTFEYSNSLYSDNKIWGTWNFDLEKPQVQSFLISSALFWITEFHIDGIRMDSVSNIIYKNYDSNSDLRIKIKNNEGIKFLKRLNKIINEKFPTVIKIAEESSSFPKVTGDIKDGGLGFDFKWNMGWMHDTLRFFEMDPSYRRYNFKLLTFSFLYYLDEKFILPFSHDEVVHGKKSLMNKMPGDRYNQFANLRTLMVYMLMFPGKKLNFMGYEWGQYLEWRDWSELEWKDLSDSMNIGMNRFTKKINEIYKNNRSLWEKDCEDKQINYTNMNCINKSIMGFIRNGKKKYDFIIVEFNFVPVEHKNHIIGVPFGGNYQLLINTEYKDFGGTWTELETTFKAKKEPYNNQPFRIEVTLPSMGALMIKYENKRTRSNER